MTTGVGVSRSPAPKATPPSDPVRSTAATAPAGRSRPRGARGPAGPSRIEPAQPKTPKHRRQMAKAAAWRLAKLLHVRPADILASPDLQGLVIRAFPHTGPCSGRGPAARLAAKVTRLAVPKA